MTYTRSVNDGNMCMCVETNIATLEATNHYSLNKEAFFFFRNVYIQQLLSKW